MPTLIVLGILMYVDRVLRQEIIFDSSALTCTVYAMHVLNLCRSSIAHIDSSAMAVANQRQQQQESLYAQFHHNNMNIEDHNSSSSSIHSNLHLQQPATMMQNHIWQWQQTAVMLAYALISILLLLDIDLASILLPAKQCLLASYNHTSNNEGNSAHFSQQQHQQPESSNILRVSTIVVHCLLVGCVLQIPVNQTVFVVPWKIMVRSFLFAFLSIFWTYAVGIHQVTTTCIYASFFILLKPN